MNPTQIIDLDRLLDGLNSPGQHPPSQTPSSNLEPLIQDKYGNGEPVEQSLQKLEQLLRLFQDELIAKARLLNWSVEEIQAIPSIRSIEQLQGLKNRMSRELIQRFQPNTILSTEESTTYQHFRIEYYS
ncbi:MAG: hypothetical protein N2450_07835 [bacterium]|nr:hypothetical protein [bacterium]